MKHLTIGLIIFMCMLCSCGTKPSEGGETVSARQIEEAHNAGREAAKEFIGKNWQDTLRLQQCLVEAGSKAAVYDSLPSLRAAYDSAFISTIRTVRPEIAAELDSYRKNSK